MKPLMLSLSKAKATKNSSVASNFLVISWFLLPKYTLKPSTSGVTDKHSRVSAQFHINMNTRVLNSSTTVPSSSIKATLTAACTPAVSFHILDDTVPELMPT